MLNEAKYLVSWADACYWLWGLCDIARTVVSPICSLGCVVRE